MRRIGGEIERLDAAVVALAREETALRLRLGQVLEVSSRGAVFELGFSSLAAYALERCARSVRWAEAARCLARRVESLPQLRRAMALGKVSWSMGELLARVARSEDEARWLEVAERRTVREVRVLVAQALAGHRAKAAARVVGPAALQERHAANAVGAGARGVASRFEAGAMRVGGRAANAGERECRAQLEGNGTVEAGVAAPAGNGADWAESGTGWETPCTLTCTVTREEAWLFEATRSLLRQLGVHGADAEAEALLAEGFGSLLVLLPEGTLGGSDPMPGCAVAQQRWLSELERWRAEAEVLCEDRIRARLLASRAGDAELGAPWGAASAPAVLAPALVIPALVIPAVVAAAAGGMVSLAHARCTELDGEVRALSEALARRELEFSALVLRLHRGDGWRRLGYATETQYARERLGISQSSFLARRSLALRLETLPAIAAALGAGQLGVEAALQLVRVATASTEAAWVARARRRTIKHLREEVAAALVAVRSSGEVDCPPPLDGEMAAFEALEQAVVSGRACQSLPSHANEEALAAVARSAEGGRREEAAAGPASKLAGERRHVWRTMLGSLAAWLASAFQMSAAGTQTSAAGTQMSAEGTHAARSGAVSSAGRVTLRLRMSRANYSWWRGLEARARSVLPRGMSWLRFLCLSLWRAWQPSPRPELAYGHIYIRDRYRCTSPVCSRRDVTPHHLRFRSAGGGDLDENLTAACSWCHLRGVHGGRIRATGTGRRIRWELGPRGAPCVVVHGRERVAA